MPEQRPRALRELPQLTPLPDTVSFATAPHRSLAGSWTFVPAPVGPPPGQEADWRLHDVPGQWALEGYTVDECAGEAGWYQCEFRVPPRRTGRTKLRFGAVYSDATVWVNGERIGTHVGGYTPFEFDVTGAVSPGPNRLSIAVRESSRAAELDWGNVTGGITRDVELVAVPECNLSAFHVETEYDEENATVRAGLTVTNDGEQEHIAPDLEVVLAVPDGTTVGTKTYVLDAFSSGESRDLAMEFDVEDPLPWTPESPSLYEVNCTLTVADERVTVSRRAGIRELSVVDDELRLNGTTLELRGMNWEEVDPDREAVISSASTRADVERLREANVNYVRPHTFPPTEAFLDACDELRILVQVELPFTFVRGEIGDVVDDDAYRDLMCHTAMEVVVRDRSHPSVILWSLANESEWGSNFEAVADAITSVDSTRPLTFNWAEYRENDAAYCGVANHHYPELRTPGSLSTVDFEGFDRPVLFDEFVHLYCYNHRELRTDPGLRDEWGQFLDSAWETVRGVDAAVGATIFSGIDHVHPEFRWGILDAHRRERPEYWHVKKVYAPVRARVADRTPTQVTVELTNRHLFRNLSDCRIEWSVGGESGTVDADIPPGETGTLTLPVPDHDGSTTPVSLRVFDDDGFLLDAYRFEADKDVSLPEAGASGAISSENGTVEFTVDDPESRWVIDRDSGRLTATDDRNRILETVPTPVLTPLEPGQTGPRRIVDPFDGRVSGWTVERVQSSEDAVILTGSTETVDGTVSLTPLESGWVRVSYELTLATDVTAREVGLALDLTPGHETLSWDRDAYWSVYPADHIGRPIGTATAFPSSERPEGTEDDVSRPWSRSVTPDGSKDFRSTKRYVHVASVTDDAGHGLSLQSGSDTHVRAAVTAESVRLFVLSRSLAGSGGEWFDRNASVGENPTLEAGTTLEDSFDVRVGNECATSHYPNSQP